MLRRHVLGVSRPDERARLLVDDGAVSAGVGVDLDQPEPLMAAIDFFISEVMPVLFQRSCGVAEVDAVDLGPRLLLGWRRRTG